MARLIPTIRLTDEQYDRLADLAQIPRNRARGLRTVLDWDLTHYVLSTREFSERPVTSVLVNGLESVRKRATALLRAIDRHPELRARLAGGLMLIETPQHLMRNDAARVANEKLNQRIEAIRQIERLPTILLGLGIVGRERATVGTGSYDPPTASFISVLLNFWRHRLNRRVRNWVGPNGESAADLTRFVHACLEIGGHRSSLESVRVKVDRVKGRMDRNKRAGKGWTVWSR